MNNAQNQVKVYAVIGGVDYEGESFDSLQLFDCYSAAEKYQNQLTNDEGFDYALLKIRSVDFTSAILCAAWLTSLTETNKMTLSAPQLATLIDNYANYVLDGMDMDTLVQFAYDSLVAEYNKYSETELLSEIEELYDEEVVEMLLESATAD